MGATSEIGWTDATFNAVRGCVEVSPGCTHCYARQAALRNPAVLGLWGTEANGGTRVVAAEKMWASPLRWAPSRIFTASLSDVFEEWNGPMVNSRGEVLNAAYRAIEDGDRPLTMRDVRLRLFALIDATPQHQWLVLTKRAGRLNHEIDWLRVHGPDRCRLYRDNLWLGVTVENQKMAEARVPCLVVHQYGPVRFLSLEPLLGPVDVAPWLGRGSGVNWLIVGCESGTHRRPLDLAWVRSLRDQAAAAGVAFFVKQLEIDGKVTQDVSLFPEDLRIQQFPKVAP